MLMPCYAIGNQTPRPAVLMPCYASGNGTPNLALLDENMCFSFCVCMLCVSLRCAHAVCVCVRVRLCACFVCLCMQCVLRACVLAFDPSASLAVVQGILLTSLVSRKKSVSAHSISPQYVDN